MLVHEDILRFVRISENAFAPTKGSPDAAGFDLYSAYDYEVQPGGKILALTDLQIAVPDDCYGRVAPRSGLAHKHFIDVGGNLVKFEFYHILGLVVIDTNIKKYSNPINFINSIPTIMIVKIYNILAGVIDRDYRGNVGVILFNFGKQVFKSKSF